MLCTRLGTKIGPDISGTSLFRPPSRHRKQLHWPNSTCCLANLHMTGWFQTSSPCTASAREFKILYGSAWVCATRDAAWAGLAAYSSDRGSDSAAVGRLRRSSALSQLDGDRRSSPHRCELSPPSSVSLAAKVQWLTRVLRGRWYRGCTHDRRSEPFWMN